MHDVNVLIEVILGWIVIVMILIRMIDEGLLDELQNLIEDIKKRRII